MTESTKFYPIIIDLNEFKLHIALKKRIELILYFNSPSRRFYLSVIALVVMEMKRLGKVTSIPLKGHHDLLALLNETIGGSAGSSETQSLLPRIYRKWRHALPNLEDAQLFKVLGRKKGYEEGIGKTYLLTEDEKDNWANLFEHKGSDENVRLKFAVDRIGATLNDIAIVYEDSLNTEAWERFISSLKDKEWEKEKGEEQEAEPAQPVPGEPEVVVPPSERKETLWSGRYRWVALMAVVVVVLGAITLAIWRIHKKPDPGDVASIEKMAFPLPNNPSIAVLPFANMSGDPKQEFLCDGMTEAIITALSRNPRLFVIARTSTDTYKGKPVKVKQVSEELGVRYVLEGSVQRSGDRLRITTQLIDALTGRHLWSKLYDREVKDMFALEDEITINILENLRVKVEGGDTSIGEKLAEKYYRGKQGLECYLKLAEARSYYNRLNIDDNNRARQLTEEAISMCPENPMGYVHFGWIYWFDIVLSNTKSPRETLEKGMQLAQKALAMDDSISNAHILLGLFYLRTRDYDKAITEYERARALAPGSAYALYSYAYSLAYTGRPKEAIPLFEQAIRLSPFSPNYLYREYAVALRLEDRFEEAISAGKKAIQIAPNDLYAHIGVTISYSLMGREKEARTEAAEILRIDPKFSLDNYAKAALLTSDRYIAALRKAGLK